MSILIKNGRVITAETDQTADVYIERETVTAVGQNLAMPADTVIDASGKYVIPGGIDVHTHLDMPYGSICSSDDFETGTRAAAFGGTTAIIDFATQSKGQSLLEALDLWHGKADGRACIDYGFHMIITDLPDERLAEMDRMIGEGVTTFKLFMAYPGRLMIDDPTIGKAMRQTVRNGGVVLLHAEDGPSIEPLVAQAVARGDAAPKYHALTRPSHLEGEAVRRAILLAEEAGSPVYIVHVASEDALRHIAGAQKKGLPVFGETCPQYLFLSLDDIDKPGEEGAKYVFTPPVRDKRHQEPLWQGLQNHSLEVVATDHCPFLLKDKFDGARKNFVSIPNGGPGIEHRMQLLFEGGVNAGRFSPQRWVELTSTNPAKLFGMYPRKGTIAPGADADIVIWDPEQEHILSASTHHMRVDYSMYEGFPIQGNAETVLSRGRIIVDKGTWKGTAGHGQFIRRDPFGPMWEA